MSQEVETLGKRTIWREEVVDAIQMRVQDVLEIRSLGDDVVELATGSVVQVSLTASHASQVRTVTQA